MRDMKICIADNINTLMRVRGINSLKELAQKCDIPLTTLHHLKNGRVPRSWQAVAKLAECLGVSMFYLVFGCEDPVHANFTEKLLKEVFSGKFEVQINIHKKL